jgi:hypothetical protein
LTQTVRDFGYGEALRSLTDQATRLEQLRGRAGTLLAAASLITGFLGGLALASPTLTNGVVSRPPISMWGWAAICAFCVVGVLTIAILLPYEFRFTMDPVSIVTNAEALGLSVEDIKSDLTTYHWANYNKNSRTLNLMYTAFTMALAVLLLETVFWIFDLRGS